MIVPSVHRSLRREDLARLVSEIARGDPGARGEAISALERGEVDELLDAPAALSAVRGYGGAPAPLPLALLWYIPIRAALRSLGEKDITLADYAASVPLAFVRERATALGSAGESSMVAWERAIEALPPGTTARAERAADCGALAMWWASCFPEAVIRAGGRGLVRAYLVFAGLALRQAAEVLQGRASSVARLYSHAAEQMEVVHEALRVTSVDYLGKDAHTSDGRTRRFLARLEGDPC